MSQTNDITPPRPAKVCELCKQECAYFCTPTLPTSGSHGAIYDTFEERNLNLCEDCTIAIQEVLDKLYKPKNDKIKAMNEILDKHKRMRLEGK